MRLLRILSDPLMIAVVSVSCASTHLAAAQKLATGIQKATPALAAAAGKKEPAELPLPVDKSMSVSRALGEIRVAMAHCATCQEYGRFTVDGYTYFAGGNVTRNEYKDMQYLPPAKHSARASWCVDQLRGKHERTPCWMDEDAQAQTLSQQFVAAMNRMIWEYTPEGQAQAASVQKALEAWQSAPVKPAMPDEAHVHQVLAENAVREKNFDKAVDEYEAALEIFPTWPDGQSNVALICGETGDYDCAIEHMQDYLELVPNAADAQAAKDKLIIWKDKLSQSQAQAAPPDVEAKSRRR